MKLACEGCDWTTERDTTDDLLSAMMRHGEERHGNMFEGKKPGKIAAMQRMMQAPRPPR
ncbi:MAG: hypothetical protein OXS29_09405 [bacterium]|nr:hypothetical protein [bacterium]MDE0288644.1 hypothetical protein [bacterium]MDE0439862.1 hypothetical protein [bacterium]